MPTHSLESIEAALEDARALDDERAIAILREAHQSVRHLGDEADSADAADRHGAESPDQGADDVATIDLENDDPAAVREALETRLEQRIRAIKQRDAYDGGMGAAMNPEDDDAP